MSESIEQFRGMAAAYGRWSQVYGRVLDPTLLRMAQDTLEIAGVSAGQRVLDLASGTGPIARAAAALGARVVAVDISLGMISTARRLSTFTIGYAVADAGDLPLAPRRFDVGTCGLSLTHFPDASAALLEVHRLLLPGGVFVASAWGSSGNDPSFSAAFAAFTRHTGNRPRRFSKLLDEKNWSNPVRGRKTLQRAGFEAVQVITRRQKGSYPNATDAVEWVLAWPLTAEGFHQLDPDSRKALRSAAQAAVEAQNDLHWEREVHYYKGLIPRIAV